MKRLKKRYWTLLTIAIISLLYYAYHYWKYTPQRNPNPQYFMTVTGHVDPALVGKVHLKWTATYSTTKRACDKTYNHFEGVVGWRWVTRTFTTQVDHSGHYQLHIPLDYYRSGYCGWKISAIDDCTGIDEVCGTLKQFYPCGDSITCEIALNKPNPKDAISDKAYYFNSCYEKNGKWQCDLNNTDDFSSSLFIPRNQHYQLIDNFKITSTQK